MDVLKKVKLALTRAFQPEVVDLQDDDGIIGELVSEQFRRMPSLDRQLLIHNALRGASAKLSDDELRRVLAIAALTPEEYVAYTPDKRGRRKA